MNREEFDQKFPKGTYVASLNAKLGAVIARASLYMSRARDFKETDLQYKALVFSAEKLLAYARKMSDELKSLFDGAPSPAAVVTPEQQEVLEAVEDCIAKHEELPEELWQKFWDAFGIEIENKYGAPN